MENKDTASKNGFHVSPQPLVRPREKLENHGGRSEIPEQLPRTYGEPILFAIARDPKSIFVYWDIDWENVFANVAPSEQKVFLRMHDGAGTEIRRVAVEPFAGMADIVAWLPDTSCTVEIGFLDSDQHWQNIATSESITMPPDKIGELAPGDFALVPFHITFQRLTELFRKTRKPNESLTQSLSELEQRSAQPAPRLSFTLAESEVYRAMKASARRITPTFPLNPGEETRLQKRLEGVVGFGGSSSSAGPGGSSRVA